jgi:DNA-binding MarR family transcriptional regulator
MTPGRKRPRQLTDGRVREARIAGTVEVRSALDALRRIVQTLRIGAREVEQRAGLSSAQLFALQQIAEHPSVSINDLAGLTFTHQSSVSVVIQRLAAEGLVVKLVSPDDRRRQRLALTATGRRALGRAPAAVQERLIDAIASLPAGERRALARTLGEVARRLAPTDVTAHPPMLFEERGRRSRARRTVGRRKE